jgi:hypothetical protein
MARNVVECVIVLWRNVVIQSQGIACVLREDWENTVNKVRFWNYPILPPLYCIHHHTYLSSHEELSRLDTILYSIPSSTLLRSITLSSSPTQSIHFFLIPCSASPIGQTHVYLLFRHSDIPTMQPLVYFVSASVHFPVQQRGILKLPNGG